MGDELAAEAVDALDDALQRESELTRMLEDARTERDVARAEAREVSDLRAFFHRQFERSLAEKKELTRERDDAVGRAERLAGDACEIALRLEQAQTSRDEARRELIDARAERDAAQRQVMRVAEEVAVDAQTFGLPRPTGPREDGGWDELTGRLRQIVDRVLRSPAEGR